jgi:hypothetical protein
MLLQIPVAPKNVSSLSVRLWKLNDGHSTGHSEVAFASVNATVIRSLLCEIGHAYPLCQIRWSPALLSKLIVLTFSDSFER